MPQLLLRITTALLTITIGGISLALAVGHTIPAEMLSTSVTPVVVNGNRYSPKSDFLLIDLNRHLRVRMPILIDEVIETILIQGNGQEAFILTEPINRRLYHYDLITDTLRELPSMYNNRETEKFFVIDDLYSLIRSGDNLWTYDYRDGAVYRLDIIDGTIEHVVTLIDENPTEQPLSENLYPAFSPGATQIVYVDDEMIYVFNTDGNNLRRYPNPVDAIRSYAYWSQDEQYLHIIGSPSTTDATNSFRMLDLRSGELVAATADLEGDSFAPCWQHETLAYVDTERQAQLLNYQTGEETNLSLIPELAGQRVQSVLWLSSCEWIVVTMDVQSSNNLIGLLHRQMYIVSRDGQTLHSLGDDVSILTWIDADSFLLAEAQATGGDLVYEVRFDGAVHRTFVGNSIPTGPWLGRPSSDPYRLLVYGIENFQIALFDLRTGDIETYFTADELIDFPVQWYWE